MEAAEVGDVGGLLGQLKVLRETYEGIMRAEMRVYERCRTVATAITVFNEEIMELLSRETVIPEKPVEPAGPSGPPPVEDIHEARAVIAALWNELKGLKQS